MMSIFNGLFQKVEKAEHVRNYARQTYEQIVEEGLEDLKKCNSQYDVHWGPVGVGANKVKTLCFIYAGNLKSFLSDNKVSQAQYVICLNTNPDSNHCNISLQHYGKITIDEVISFDMKDKEIKETIEKFLLRAIEKYIYCV